MNTDQADPRKAGGNDTAREYFLPGSIGGKRKKKKKKSIRTPLLPQMSDSDEDVSSFISPSSIRPSMRRDVVIKNSLHMKSLAVIELVMCGLCRVWDLGGKRAPL